MYLSGRRATAPTAFPTGWFCPLASPPSTSSRRDRQPSREGSRETLHSASTILSLSVLTEADFYQLKNVVQILQDGLKVGDRVAVFGSVNADNFGALSDVGR